MTKEKLNEVVNEKMMRDVREEFEMGDVDMFWWQGGHIGACIHFINLCVHLSWFKCIMSEMEQTQL